MATVWLARDLRHDRPVALKVLRPELALAIGPERFLREIRTTAGLRHPNVLPLYDSGEADGLLWYAMPYVEGETLRDRMDRESQLPIDDALRIADEIAAALEHAHARGIVHRDVKPENVLLEDGRAVVTDFGIAAAAADGDGDRLTRTGTSVGTPLYMSPEQASGEAVDARSDLYSAACVLYEMLAGQPPFTGTNGIAILARHLTDPVPPITTTRPTVTPGLASLVDASLAKVPADRIPSMTEWRDRLRTARATGDGAAAAGSAPRSAAPERILVPPPAPPTDLIGRADLLDDALEQLEEGVRLLTLTGVGGTGKTRFAIELFRRREGACAGGAAYVSLASVTSADDVLPTLAANLAIAEAHGRSALDGLTALLGDRSVLLVIDNFEQVVEAAGRVAELLARCPGVQLVVTSRRPLKVGAEVEFPLPTLALPDAADTDPARLATCPSVALFVERARRVKPGFELTDDTAGAVAKICRSLDGLPLALELAAARVRVLTPDALLDRLDHALDLLTSGDRDLPLRQRTLRATISWSYSLLSEEEKTLLRRLSVFHEGWSFEAMEGVCYAREERWRALDELDSLVEKGLVRVLDDGARYTLLETIRAFAAEQLHAGGEVEAVRNAHADYFLDFAREVDHGIQNGTQLESMARGRAENANCFAAVHWYVGRGRLGDPDAVEKGMRMCGWLAFYWHIVGLHLVAESAVLTLQERAAEAGIGPTLGTALSHFSSAMVWANTGDLERAWTDFGVTARHGEVLGDPALHALGLATQGYAALGLGDVERAESVLEAGVAMAGDVSNDFVVGISRSFLGMLRFMQGDLETGLELIESARRLQIPAGDYEGGGMTLSFLASMTFAQGDVEGALGLYRESEAAFATVGDKPELARVQCETGYVELSAGRASAARWTFQRALRTYDEVGSPRGTGQALMGLAATEASTGNAARALSIAAAAEELSRRAGVVVVHPLAPGVAEMIEEMKASIPRGELDALVRSGGAMTPAEVLAMVAA